MITIGSFSISEQVLKLVFLFLAAAVIHQIAFRIIVPLFKRMAKKTINVWDDIIIERKVLKRALHILPATVLSFGLPLVMDTSGELYTILTKAIILYYIIVGYLVFEALLNVVLDLYELNEKSKKVSIRGFVQAIKIIGFLFALILVISQLAGKSPVVFLSGLGAFTAIILLFFKDSILGLVAGIQLSTNDLVRKGDWIEIPKHGADGDVIDISLTTVRVQNWDKTITAVPAYDLVSSSFKNWRGMSESGGRRIKRSINIDLNTIRFLQPDEIEKLMKIKLLRPYLEERINEIKKANSENYGSEDLMVVTNGRRLTNIGTFRAYCIAYLRNHPGIHQKLTFLIRQLDLTPNGLPLEIYVFCNDTAWVAYEGIQADIFDHLLAVLPEFNLRAFQMLSGEDIKRALQGSAVPVCEKE
ncbi:MAG: mechanosensitive ion channel family protein [Fibrobacter sp.]|nr:mechanosensitive ion channel family protein [Fibrobacter sp.]